MVKSKRSIRIQRSIAIGVVLATVAGCTQTTDWLKGRRTAKPTDSVILGAPEADSYLQELHDLAAGDPARQAEIFADAESGALLTPAPNTELRLALVLATPGHPESNPEKAESMLREVLAQTELLTQAGHVKIDWLEMRLVCEEEVSFSDGTDTRAESKRVYDKSTNAMQTPKAIIFSIADR